MGIIIYNNDEIETEDGESIIGAATQLGVPFNCKKGKCGSCLIRIISGGENLHPKDLMEENFGLDEEERLACRCYLEEGEVEIDF